MSRASKSQASFNGGWLSPRLRGRTDQAVYFIGLDEMTGWLPVLQGPAVAAPGTHYVATAKGPFRLIPFEFNVTQGYQIEASDGTFRFYTNDVRIEPTPGTPLEVAHPYSYDQVKTLNWAQSEDVLYLVGGNIEQRKLARTGAEAFDLRAWTFKGGPFEDDNSDEGVTVTASGTAGSVTLTASTGIFAATDIGALFKLEAKDFADIPRWEVGIDGNVAGTTKRVSDGKVYLCDATSIDGRTGTVPPTHDRGSAWDGSSAGTDINSKGPFGCRWQFLYGPIGTVRITGYTSATEVTADVIDPLADSVAGGGTSIWAHGSFSDTRGHPDVVVLWNQRVCLMRGNRGWGGVVGDFDNFATRDSSGNAQRDLGFSFTLPDPDPILWAQADKKLVFGTAKGEWACEQLQVQSQAASPPPIEIQRQSGGGSRATRPIATPDGRILFIQRAGRKVLELGYSIDVDRFKPIDQTRFADHIGRTGIVELAWAQEPEAIVWAVRGDGSLAAMTYSAAEDVHGWAARPLGAGLVAKTVSTNTDPAGERDQVWVGAQYGSGDDPPWFVLRMEKIWQTGDTQGQAFFVDAGLSYSGAPVMTGTGLLHLAGATCAVLADGKPHPPIVIANDGRWTIGYEASDVQIGLDFPALMKLLPIEAGADDGTAQGKIQRIADVAIRVLETQGIRITVQDLDAQPVETRVPGDPMDEAVPLYSGDLKLDMVGSYERLSGVTIERYQPTPATILAVIPTVIVSPR